jgi:FkbM family methyltransferase
MIVTRPMPAVASPVIRLAQRLCCDAGPLRGYGVPRLIRKLARIVPSWRSCRLTGPDGKPFFVDLSQGHFNWVVDGWRTEAVESLASRLPRDAVIFDIGANIGVMTRAMAQHVPDGMVYAFEPSAENFAVLAANTRGNPNVRGEQWAVGAKTGSARLSSTTTASLVRHLMPDGRGGVPVSITRLDDFCTRHHVDRIDMIKIDVEGFEEEALVPAEATLKRFRPVVLFEYIPEMAQSRSAFRGHSLFPLFARLGYKVRRMDDHGGMHDDLGDGPDRLNDYAALPGG